MDDNKQSSKDNKDNSYDCTEDVDNEIRDKFNINSVNEDNYNEATTNNDNYLNAFQFKNESKSSENFFNAKKYFSKTAAENANILKSLDNNNISDENNSQNLKDKAKDENTSFDIFDESLKEKGVSANSNKDIFNVIGRRLARLNSMTAKSSRIELKLEDILSDNEMQYYAQNKMIEINIHSNTIVHSESFNIFNLSNNYIKIITDNLNSARKKSSINIDNKNNSTFLKKKLSTNYANSYYTTGKLDVSNLKCKDCNNIINEDIDDSGCENNEQVNIFNNLSISKNIHYEYIKSPKYLAIDKQRLESAFKNAFSNQIPMDKKESYEQADYTCYNQEGHHLLIKNLERNLEILKYDQLLYYNNKILSNESLMNKLRENRIRLSLPVLYNQISKDNNNYIDILEKLFIIIDNLKKSLDEIKRMALDNKQSSAKTTNITINTVSNNNNSNSNNNNNNYNDKFIKNVNQSKTLLDNIPIDISEKQCNNNLYYKNSKNKCFKATTSSFKTVNRATLVHCDDDMFNISINNCNNINNDYNSNDIKAMKIKIEDLQNQLNKLLNIQNKDKETINSKSNSKENINADISKSSKLFSNIKLEINKEIQQSIISSINNNKDNNDINQNINNNNNNNDNNCIINSFKSENNLIVCENKNNTSRYLYSQNQPIFKSSNITNKLLKLLNLSKDILISNNNNNNLIEKSMITSIVIKLLTKSTSSKIKMQLLEHLSNVLGLDKTDRKIIGLSNTKSYVSSNSNTESNQVKNNYSIYEAVDKINNAIIIINENI